MDYIRIDHPSLQVMKTVKTPDSMFCHIKLIIHVNGIFLFVKLSLKQLARLLRFVEEGDDLRDFLAHYGLNPNALNRDDFIQPESQYK